MDASFTRYKGVYAPVVRFEFTKKVKGLKIVIRRLEPADFRDLLFFFEENNLAEVTRHFHPFPLTFETARILAYMPCLDRYYAAFYDNHLIGFSMLRGWDEGYSVPSFGMLVDRNFHNRGVGKSLLLFSIEEARRLGCKQVRLSVYASNRAALRLYELMGFVVDSRDPVSVAGEGDEKIVMLKNL